MICFQFHARYLVAIMGILSTDVIREALAAESDDRGCAVVQQHYVEPRGPCARSVLEDGHASLQKQRRRVFH